MMKIKCLLVALFISVLMCIPTQAQDDTRHEVSFSFGVVPNSIWIDLVNDVLTTAAGADINHSGVVGPISLEYHYRTSHLIAVGAIAAFAGHNEEQELNGALYAKSKNSYFTLMPSVKFNWLRRANWGLYSKVAAGASLRHSSIDRERVSDKSDESDNMAFFNFQLSALGFEAGTENVLGFAELGVGEQGIALAGVRFKF